MKLSDFKYDGLKKEWKKYTKNMKKFFLKGVNKND